MRAAAERTVVAAWPWPWPGWLTPLVFGVLAVCWTWPAAVAGDTLLVGRNFDLPGTLWFLDAIPRLGLDLDDPLTGHPEGHAYGRPDSFTLFLLGPLGGLLGVGRLHGLLQVLGVTASAWAAEAFAREVGARAPWSLLAGLGFAFGGLASTVLLEGHVYHLLDPWLPLFGLCWWRATRPGGTALQGALAGLLFGLTLLSSGYLGIAGAVVAVGLALGGLSRWAVDRRAGGEAAWALPWRPLLAAAAVVALFAVPYALQFLASEGQDITDYQRFGVSRREFLRTRSADLVRLAGPTWSLDTYDHSNAMTLSATVLALVMVAPWVLRGRRGWGTLLGTALAGLVLPMGTELGSPELGTVPLPLSLVADTALSEFIRFPMRLGWGWMLCGSVLAAWTASRLASSVGRPVLVLLPLALVEVYVIHDLPDRQRSQLAAVPSAYAAQEGAILDLYPEAPAREYELNAWFAAWACYYQTGHGRPIADDCVGTHSMRNPRIDKERQLVAALLQGDAAGVRRLARGWGFATLALHADLYPPGDRARLMAVLSQLDPEPVESTDGGERILAYGVGP